MTLSLKINNLSKELIGTFENDNEYFKALKILINSSSELITKNNFLKNKILPFINKKSILDIGIGDGEFSKNIYKNFDVIHLIDPSALSLTLIKEDEFPNKVIKKFKSKIENFLFPLNSYDFILNCHTLYHLKRDDWKTIIEKSCDSLKSQGMQLIAINNGLGRSKLTNFFGNYNIIDIEKLIEECVSIKDVSLEIYPFYEKLKTKDLEEAIQISSVFLHDINISTDRDLLVNYLNNNCIKDNHFIIDYCQYFIILRKNN